MDRNLALLIARFCFASVFLYSGSDKLLNWSAGLGEMAGLGLRLPAVALASVIAAQLGGGILVLLGMFTRLGAAVLAVFTVVATLIAHAFWGLEGLAFKRQLTTTLEHLAIVGGLLLLFAAGAGRFSVDAARTQPRRAQEDRG